MRTKKQPEARLEDDKDVAMQAVQAMERAYSRAVKAGHTLVMVHGSHLVRREPDGRLVVMKKLKPRKKITQRIIKLKPAHE